MKHNDYDKKVASLMAKLPSKGEVTPEKHKIPAKTDHKIRALIVVFAGVAALLGIALWQLSTPPEIITSTFDY